MGRNHVRILGELPDAVLVGLVDPDTSRAQATVGATGAAVYATIDELPQVDIAVIATPTPYHVATAEALIARGTSLLIEKPLAPTVEESERLVRLAHEAGVTLAVGHVERFNAAFEMLAAITKDPVFIQFERLSPYTPRISDSVIFDLMVHDLDLACWIAGGYPVSVGAAGMNVFSDSFDVASAVLEFPSGCVARLDASRVTQDKVRRAAISERDRYLVADSMRQDVSIKRQVEVSQSEDGGVPAYRQASVMEVPWMSRTGEPLARELQDLIDSVRVHRAPRVTGEDGLRAVKLAYAVERAAS
jgi:predicted dehydrogenase